MKDVNISQKDLTIKKLIDAKRQLKEEINNFENFLMKWRDTHYFRTNIRTS